MSPLFLLGGGLNEASYVRTYWRFITAATDWPEVRQEGESGQRSIAIVIAPGPEDDRAALEAAARAPFELFEPVKKEQCHVLFVTRREPLSVERLAAVQPSGVFVAGGCTPLYHDALLADRGWLDYVLQRELPCAGYSAGAVLMSPRALVGGWILPLLHSNAEVVSESAAEGLDYVELRDGLGLVPFTVEAHATQWGTLCRLTQLAAEGAVTGGWAIDEGCMLEVVGDELRVFGPNAAYRVRRLADGAVRTDVFRAGTVLRRNDW